MKKIKLPQVTLIGIDCVDVSRIQKALDISSEQIEFAEVKLLTSLETSDSRKVEIPHLGSVESYSEFCLKDLVSYVDTEFVLIVQYDGFVLNADSWSDEFLKYDYIGAPWFMNKEFWFKDFRIPRSLKNTWVVGNGGFSLRSKKLLRVTSRFADEGVLKHVHPEDIVISVDEKNNLEKEGIKIAPKEIAERFSIEGQTLKYNKQFGFHGLKWTNITKWIKQNKKWGVRQNRFLLIFYR